MRCRDSGSRAVTFGSRDAAAEAIGIYPRQVTAVLSATQVLITAITARHKSPPSTPCTSGINTSDRQGWWEC